MLKKLYKTIKSVIPNTFDKNLILYEFEKGIKE
jgi:hypothetical protein